MARNNRESLFAATDERDFKRQFVIAFLASQDAVNFQENCHRGWKGHRPAVEDAACLAETAWDEWVKTIGVKE